MVVPFLFLLGAAYGEILNFVPDNTKGTIVKNNVSSFLLIDEDLRFAHGEVQNAAWAVNFQDDVVPIVIGINETLSEYYSGITMTMNASKCHTDSDVDIVSYVVPEMPGTIVANHDHNFSITFFDPLPPTIRLDIANGELQGGYCNFGDLIKVFAWAPLPDVMYEDRPNITVVPADEAACTDYTPCDRFFDADGLDKCLASTNCDTKVYVRKYFDRLQMVGPNCVDNKTMVITGLEPDIDPLGRLVTVNTGVKSLDQCAHFNITKTRAPLNRCRAEPGVPLNHKTGFDAAGYVYFEVNDDVTGYTALHIAAIDGCNITRGRPRPGGYLEYMAYHEVAAGDVILFDDTVIPEGLN